MNEELLRGKESIGVSSIVCEERIIGWNQAILLRSGA